MASSFYYKAFNSLAISCNSLLNMCEYIFNIVAISLWPKYFETKATLAPLFSIAVFKSTLNFITKSANIIIKL